MVGIFRVALCVDLIVLLLGSRTLMPVDVGWMFVMDVVGLDGVGTWKKW